MTDTDLLDYKGVSAVTGLSVGTLRGYRSAGRMPKPDVMLAPDRPRWRRATITTWLNDPEQRPGRGAPGRPRKRRTTV